MKVKIEEFVKLDTEFQEATELYQGTRILTRQKEILEQLSAQDIPKLIPALRRKKH